MKPHVLTPPSVRVLRTFSELDELRSLWESWPGNRDSHPDTYLTVLRLRSEVLRPHVIVVYRDGFPETMLVGRLERVRMDFKVGYLHFRPKADLLYFVYGGPRGNASRENCDLLVQEICKSLEQGEADLAFLNFLRTDSHLNESTKRIPGFVYRDHIRTNQRHFTATIPASVEEFYRGLSANARWQAKSKQRKLAKAFPGSVNVRCFRSVAEISDLVRDAELIAGKSYQRALGVGFVDTAEVREHLRLKAERGWLRAYVLYVDDHPCAFWIGDLNQGTFGSDYLAYDSDFGSFSPGTCLMFRVIEDFCNGNGDGVQAIDFATGYAQYKEVLGSRHWMETSAYIFAPSLKGLELKLVRSFTAALGEIVKRILAQAGLLQKMKKSWRTHAKQHQTAEA